jgi:hypothetical protein
MNMTFKNSGRRGAALLVVLFVIMAITVLSLGFLSRSDIELACGRGIVLKSQMDYLAESGMEHAKGLILNPQDISETWSGCTSQRLVNGSNDYYDIKVTRDDSDANDYCNYIIDCNAYRLQNGEQTGFSAFTARLRLDPCIGIWSGENTLFWPGVSIKADVFCIGTLTGTDIIGGDVFAGTFSGSKTGQKYTTGELSLTWPQLNAANIISHYDIETIGSGTISSQTFGPYNPVRVCHRSGNLELTGNVKIDGMLLVEGNLTVSGTGNSIVAEKNLPALYVTGDLKIQGSANLDIEGLVVVDGRILINGSATVNVLGGLFTDGGFYQTARDSSGNNSYAVLHSMPEWSSGKINGTVKFDGTDDYAEVENESNFDITSRITVAAWIKVNAFDKAYQAIVTKGDNAWRIQRNASTNTIEFACTGLPHNQYGNVTGSKSVNDGQWHHLAGVYDGNNLSLYVDGVIDKSIHTSGWINTNNEKVLIGDNSQAAGRYWNGWIDDVQIYNRGLDVNDVTLVKAGTTVSGLVAHWKFDENYPSFTVTAEPAKAAIEYWIGSSRYRWSQAGGAFYKSFKTKL